MRLGRMGRLLWFFYEPSLRKFLFVLFAVGISTVSLSACAYTGAANNYTIPQLVKLTDLNDRAFMYHHYCVGSAEPLSDKFFENYQIAPNLLLDKTMETSPLEPKMIVAQIMERRERIQSKLRRHYNEHGCSSEEAMIAREQYHVLKTYDDPQSLNFF